MPKLTVEGAAAVDVPQGKRLVNALIDDVEEVRIEAIRVAIGWRDEKTHEVLNPLLKNQDEWGRERGVAAAVHGDR